MVKESAQLLQPHLRYLQVDRPIIHKLHDILSEILLKILGRIAKPSSLVNLPSITTENFDTKNLIPLDDIILNKDIMEALKDCNDVVKAKFRLDYRNHFKEIGMHILKKTCYQNTIVKCVSVINPTKILDDDSTTKIMKVANSLPFDVPSTFIDEWCLVKATVHAEHLTTYKGRIDDFWLQFFEKIGLDSSKTFPSLSKVIKSILTIAHGSAGIERILSSSGQIITEDKTRTSLRTLNARLDTKYGIKLYFENDHNQVPVDKNFIAAARRARQSYMLYLEQMKNKEAEEKKKKLEEENRRKQNLEKVDAIAKEKRSIEEIEKILKTRERENTYSGSKLLEEANDRLKEAIKKKSLPEISLAQGMIEGAKVLMTEEQKKTSELLQLKTTVEKRKTAIIDNFLVPKK